MVFISEVASSVIMAIIQGFTEWLPISSSGHLALFERVLNYEGGLQFEVALHFGTLMAVFVYFGSDIIDIIRDFVSGRWKSENGKMALMLIIATIPAVLVGYFFKNVFEVFFDSLGIIAMGFAVSGIFLVVVSITRTRKRKVGFIGAVVVGLSQIFSLFPGISRSGSTIGTGMLFGFDDKSSIRFSFLMSIPIILGANILTIGNKTLSPSLIWATLISFLVGLLTIHLLYGKMLASKKSLRWYGLYALFVAVVLGIFILVK